MAGLPVPRLEHELARLHGCPRDCPDCARAAAQTGVPDNVLRWVPFIHSHSAYRLAWLCKQSGRPFPKLTNDDVVQFCIEEACFERLRMTERINDEARLDRLGALGLEGEEFEPAADPASEALTSARQFAATGVRGDTAD